MIVGIVIVQVGLALMGWVLARNLRALDVAWILDVAGWILDVGCGLGPRCGRRLGPRCSGESSLGI